MRIKLRVYLLALVSILGVNLYAGELSNFEIIGFNNLWTSFAFAEYGIDSQVRPYANIYIVDIARNDFVPQGVFTGKYPASDSVEANSRSALYSELLKASDRIKSYGIDPQNTAKLIYILLDSEEIGDAFDFKDYVSNYHYSIRLNQEIRRTQNVPEGAFDISVRIQKDNGTIISKTVGNNYYYREGVTQYKIRAIYSTPDNRSLIFVVEKTVKNSSVDNGIYYMVECLTWQ